MVVRDHESEIPHLAQLPLMGSARDQVNPILPDIYI